MNQLFTNRKIRIAALALALAASTAAGMAGVGVGEKAADSSDMKVAEVETIRTETLSLKKTDTDIFSDAQIDEIKASSKTSDDEVIYVNTTILEAIKKTIVYQKSDKLPEGQEVVLTQGSDGVRSIKAVKTIKNGVEVGVRRLSETVLSEPQPTVILRGTAVIGPVPGPAEYDVMDGTVNFDEVGTTPATPKKKSKKEKYPTIVNEETEQVIPIQAVDNGRTDVPDQISLFSVPEYIKFDENGLPTEYEEVLFGNATAYTADSGALMSTGNAVYQGFVAVDPDVIPYGSELYIVAEDGDVYGYAIAADTGGAARNGRIIADLFMDDYGDCISWGNKDVVVYVIK